MSEAQKTPGRVEATEEVKRLAGVCVAEGKTAAEIEGVSGEVRVQLGAYLRRLGGQSESSAATVEAAASVKEKTLPPEQAEVLLATLKACFERNEKLHRGIVWAEVEKALRAAPNLLWSLQQLETTGGEPDLLTDENDAFRFGDFSQESPSFRRNVVFDAEAEAYLRKHHPDAVCNGNAAERVAEWGVEFMSEDEYRLLQKLAKVDANTWSWLRTPADVRRAGNALAGNRYGEFVNVNRHLVYDLFVSRGFRCSLRVPKV